MTQYNLNKKIVTKEGILHYLQDIDVYRYYTGSDISITGGLHSPLRKDNNPSFGYFIGESGEICFKDFVLGAGDFVKFVQILYGLTYFEALSKIVIDFNLTYHFLYKDVEKTKKDYKPESYESRDKLLSKANNFILGKKSRAWKFYDLTYWNQFGIDVDILELYNVEPIEYIFINNTPILADKFAYCFKEFKDGKETYKIYQPFNKKYKWLNNHNDSVWQGWEQLPDKANKLIITKSLKDVMSIVNVLKIPAVSLQAESVIPKEHIINQLKDRFEYMYIWYDNDFDSDTNWGRQLGDKLQEKINTPFRYEIPDSYTAKDFSDLVKLYGKEKAIDIFRNDMSLPF